MEEMSDDERWLEDLLLPDPGPDAVERALRVVWQSDPTDADEGLLPGRADTGPLFGDASVDDSAAGALLEDGEGSPQAQNLILDSADGSELHEVGGLLAWYEEDPPAEDPLA